jgi:hypothetical protein
MRAAVGCFTCLTAIASLAFATPPETPVGATTLPTYYLRGYYKLDNQRPAWTASDAAPWSQVKSNEPWVNKRLLKWGYLPFTHDAKNYYCLIDDGPRTGSHVIDKTFMCGDPATAQWLFQNNWRPNVPLIGGGPPLEKSER